MKGRLIEFPSARRARLSPEERATIRQDGEAFDDCLAYLRAHAAGEVEGLYGPGSMTWMIYREPVVLLGGLRAILLQVAHPAVAEGISQYSRVRGDLTGRARRTYTAMNKLIFGDLDDAMAMARRIHRVHDHVRGHSVGETSELRIPFRANDPELLMWVLATLIDTAMEVYDRFVRPLTLEEKRRYYQEARMAGAQFGIDPDVMPPVLEDFYECYNRMLEGHLLRVSPPADRVARMLFNSPFTRGPIDEILTAGLLPARWREAYGLPWGPHERRAFDLLTRGVRSTLQAMPVMARYSPAYHQACKRVAVARGEVAPGVRERVMRRVLGEGSVVSIGALSSWLRSPIGESAAWVGQLVGRLVPAGSG